MSMLRKPVEERPALVSDAVHPHPVINRILQNRGISSLADMEYSLSQLIEPFAMANMREAVVLLEKHLRKQSRIVIVGDFDCDGATSTSIAVAGLIMHGAQDVHFLIPDRMIHGYGLTPSIVSLAAELEPDLIITVDNGIASFDGAQAVRMLPKRCELLITDHHLPAESGIPDADVIVNPNQHGCPFPSKDLAGCGVMFYVIMALRSHLRDQGYFNEKGMTEPKIGTLLDLVALGTVADVVPLDRNNRILIQAGLQRIRQGHARPGIRALLEIAKRDPARVVASDMGFAVGPRVNAAGRLDDMTIGIQCLLSQNEIHAMEMAQRLDDLNQQRRAIEADHIIDADAMIQQHQLDQKHGVVVFDPSWHAGVVGIVASRIKEKLNRPIICMTDTNQAQEHRQQLEHLTHSGASAEEIDAARQRLLNSEIKGSCRSVDGIHLKHVLDHINKRHPDVLTKFGGHAMAAGISLLYKDLEQFSELFDIEIAKELTKEMMLGNIEVDIENMDSGMIDIDLARQIQNLGPWGQKFPEPMFHAVFHRVNHRIMKDKHIKFVVAMEGQPGVTYEAVAFNVIKDGETVPVNDTFEASFRLDINVWREKESLQLMIDDLQDVAPEPAPQLVVQAEIPASDKPVIEQQAKARAGDPSDNTRIKGLARQHATAPISRVRDDMRSALDALKAGVTPNKHITDTPTPI